MDRNEEQGKRSNAEEESEDKEMVEGIRKIRKVWYDKEWEERKREMRKFVKGKCSGEALIEEEVAQQRKGRHEEEEMEKIKKVKTEQEAWKYTNKYRRRRREGIDEEMSEEEWKNHFMQILEETKHEEGRKTEERKRK